MINSWIVGWGIDGDLVEVWKEVLVTLGHTPTFVPWVHYENPVAEVGAKLKSERPDYVIWWNWMCVSPEDMDFLTKQNSATKHVLFNLCDPYCWSVSEHRMDERVKYYHAVIVSSQATGKLYAQAGCRNVVVAHCPFSPFHTPEPSLEYEDDISFILTNLYESREKYPDQVVSRRRLIEALENDPDINFGVYGPEYLREIAPRSYRRELGFDDMLNTFATSKIVLSTHVSSAKGYLNRRTVEALSCGSLLLVDKTGGTEALEGKCVFIDDSIPINTQVKEILRNYRAHKKTKRAALRYARSNFYVAPFVEKVRSVLN